MLFKARALGEDGGRDGGRRGAGEGGSSKMVGGECEGEWRLVLVVDGGKIMLPLQMEGEEVAKAARKS